MITTVALLSYAAGAGTGAFVLWLFTKRKGQPDELREAVEQLEDDAARVALALTRLALSSQPRADVPPQLMRDLMQSRLRVRHILDEVDPPDRDRRPW